MRVNVFFTFLILLGLVVNVQAQDLAQINKSLQEIQAKMKAFDSEMPTGNPKAEVMAANPELFDLSLEKGELSWKKYKLSPGMKTLINSYQAYHAAVKGLEYAATNNSNAKIRNIVATKGTKIFEGCIRGTLEGYNMTNGVPMYERAVVLMERYERLNAQFGKPGTSKILTKEELPTLAKYFEYLQQEKKAMVEYFVGDQMILGTITWPGGMGQIQVPNKQKTLDNIKKLQGAMQAVPATDQLAQNYADFTSSSLTLSQLLFNHALNIIPDSIKSIVVIPRKDLKAVPFDLLLRSESKNSNNSFSLEDHDYVMESYNISYANSSLGMINGEVSAIEEGVNDKLSLLKDPSQSHPANWKSLLPRGGADVVVGETRTAFNESEDMSDNESGGFKPMYLILGFLVGFALFFFGRKKSA